MPVKDKNGARISDKERAEERWLRNFDNVLNSLKVQKNILKIMKKFVTLLKYRYIYFMRPQGLIVR